MFSLEKFEYSSNPPLQKRLTIIYFHIISDLESQSYLKMIGMEYWNIAILGYNVTVFLKNFFEGV
jgi:hypothetical protein